MQNKTTPALSEEEITRAHLRELAMLLVHTAMQLALFAVVCFLATAIVIFGLNR